MKSPKIVGINSADNKGPDELGLHDILRASDVKRWTIVNMTRQQSLAEHTFNVIAIARAIAKKMGVSDVEIMKYAFDHDLDEILTGDIPTPAKELLKLKDSYEGKSRSKCSALDVAIVNVADAMEAVWYSNTNGLGRHAADVTTYCIEKLNNRITLYQSLDPKFGDAVARTIDEMEYGVFKI